MKHTIQEHYTESRSIVLCTRVCAIIFSAAILYILAKSYTTSGTDYTQYNSAQLSWVIEGCQEKIVDLNEKIEYLQGLQNLKLVEEKFGPSPSPGLYIIEGEKISYGDITA